jgi:hypothetical protein
MSGLRFMEKIKGGLSAGVQIGFGSLLWDVKEILRTLMQ